MRTGDVTKFREVMGHFLLHNLKFPSTGFVQAMNDAQASLGDAILKTTNVPTESKEFDSTRIFKQPSKRDKEKLIRHRKELEALECALLKRSKTN